MAQQQPQQAIHKFVLGNKELEERQWNSNMTKAGTALRIL